MNPSIDLNHRTRQICWRLPQKFDPNIESVENQFLNFVNTLPDFLQTILFAFIDDEEILLNTVWFASICFVCLFCIFLLRFIVTQRFQHGKQIRTRCQQFQHDLHQVELERATLERYNQKLTKELDELKMNSLPNQEEILFQLREELKRYQTERDRLQGELNEEQNRAKKHHEDIEKQVEMTKQLNDEILRLQENLEKERQAVARLQPMENCLERIEENQQIIEKLGSEINRLEEEKSLQVQQIEQLQEENDKVNVENGRFNIKLQKYQQTLKKIRQWINENPSSGSDRLLRILTDRSDQGQLEKSNDYLLDLKHQINEKSSRIHQLDLLLLQEQNHVRELEIKLKVTLQLRERDKQMSLYQIRGPDGEYHQPKTDAERVKVLQNQLYEKREEIQKLEKQLKEKDNGFEEARIKHQEYLHEKWMTIKRLTTDLSNMKKECEGLRKHIATKAQVNVKSIGVQVETNDQSSNALETIDVSSPPRENFKPIDASQPDSGPTSTTKVFIPRPPLFRPPFLPVIGPMHSQFPTPPMGSPTISKHNETPLLTDETQPMNKSSRKRTSIKVTSETV